MATKLEQMRLNPEGHKSSLTATMPASVAKTLIGGTSALGIGMVFERGLGFTANLLAARFGGASTFGAYSLAMATANNISSYAAGGIGSTAIRFSGSYSRESDGYATLSRVLVIISIVSAGVAACGLYAGAAPIAHVLGKDSLTILLRWAALSAAGIILLECCRGFLVGQRRFTAILTLSCSVGVGMVCLLPGASHIGAVRMIITQGCITLSAVLLCLLLYKPLGLAAKSKGIRTKPLGPMLRRVWSFGSIQLAGLVAMNAAGWWLCSLLAKSDASMVQMGFFAVAHQFRNMVALAPSLLTESGLAVMAHGERDPLYEPDQVMAACTFVTTFASLLSAGFAMVVVPWALVALYGRSYSAAASACALALATAVIHMGNGPAAARLSIVSIKMAGIINTVWAIFVAGSASLVFLSGRAFGSIAWEGALIYLAAHLLSAGLVFGVLYRKSCIPDGMYATVLLGVTAVLALAGLSFWRNIQPEKTLLITFLMIALCLTALALLIRIGNYYRWTPSLAALTKMVRGKRLLGSPAVDGRAAGEVNA